MWGRRYSGFQLPSRSTRDRPPVFCFSLILVIVYLLTGWPIAASANPSVELAPAAANVAEFPIKLGVPKLAAEIAKRALYRATITLEHAPPWLNAPPGEPPPLDVFPAAARRAMKAMNMLMADMAADHADLGKQPEAESSVVRVKRNQFRVCKESLAATTQRG